MNELQWVEAEPVELEWVGDVQLGQPDQPENDTLGLKRDTFWTILRIAGAALSTYHGYKRDRGSVGWAIGWGVLGYVVPYITVPVAFAQGYAKPAKR